MHSDRIPFFLALRLSVQRFQMPLECLSIAKTLATVGTIYATEALLKNMKNNRLPPLTHYHMFKYKPL